MWNRLLYFLVAMIFVTQVYIDPIIRKCESNLGITTIILHQLLNIIIIFGSLLFGYHEYHLSLIVGAFVVHKLSGICPLTKIHNKLCNVDENKPLFTILNSIVPNYPYNEKNVIMLYYVILIVIISYDVLFIARKKL